MAEFQALGPQGKRGDLTDSPHISCTCGYCSTGCNLTVEVVDGRPARVTANPSYPVNQGKACPKGFQFLGHLDAPERALSPLLRDSSGDFRPVTWEQALQTFVERFKDIQTDHGPEAVAFLSTGQLTSEEFAYLGALTKFGMGWVHGDGNTRQCMATAAVAHKQSFGFDSPPFTYADLEESDLLVFVGANPVIAHPILWQRLKKNGRRPKIVIIDPRRTETVLAAEALAGSGFTVEHLRLLPKSDLVLLYGLARLLIERGWIDRSFIDRSTAGFGEFSTHVRAFTPDVVAAATGIPPSRIEALARDLHERPRASMWWTMGVNQGYQAVRTAQGVINISLLTGNIGRPGTGANSITGQCNAMGSRLFSNTSSLFCGRDFADSRHRREVAAVLEIDEALIPRRPSLAYDQILSAVDEGRIRGLWVICTNPAGSWPNRGRLKKILGKLDFLVVQDMFTDTETAGLAHLFLPAAGCGEKEGTFINSERRIGRVRKILDPPGQALEDLQIFQRVAAAWGCGELLGEWGSSEAIFAHMKRLSRGTPCDFSGIEDSEELERRGGVQWPFPAAAVFDRDPDAERRLFADGKFYHPDGRARFVFEAVAESPEHTSVEYPLALLTGRGSVTQWHTLTRTDRAPVLKRSSPDPRYVAVHEDDAARLDLSTESLVRVRSRRGEATVRLQVSEAVQPGVVFMPMHHPDTNNLTMEAVDPYSRQPSFKYAATMVERANEGDKDG